MIKEGEEEMVVGVMRVWKRTTMGLMEEGRRSGVERARRVVERVKEMVERGAWVVGMGGEEVEEDGQIRRRGKRVVKREEDEEVKVGKEEVEGGYVSEKIKRAA